MLLLKYCGIVVRAAQFLFSIEQSALYTFMFITRLCMLFSTRAIFTLQMMWKSKRPTLHTAVHLTVNQPLAIILRILLWQQKLSVHSASYTTNSSFISSWDERQQKHHVQSSRPFVNDRPRDEYFDSLCCYLLQFHSVKSKMIHSLQLQLF